MERTFVMKKRTNRPPLQDNEIGIYPNTFKNLGPWPFKSSLMGEGLERFHFGYCLNSIPDIENSFEMLEISEQNYDLWKEYCLKPSEMDDGWEIFHLEKLVLPIEERVPGQRELYKLAIINREKTHFIVKTMEEFNEEGLKLEPINNRIVYATRSFWENCRTKFNRLFPEE